MAAIVPVVYPGPINRCSTYIDQESDSGVTESVLPKFCTCVNNASDVKFWCQQVGDGEWDLESANSFLCDFSSQNNPYGVQDCAFGRPLGNLRSTTARCVRKRFDGDPLTCCLNDYDGCGRTVSPTNTSQVNLCFTDPNVPRTGSSCNDTNCRQTCNPCYRSVTSNPSYTDGLDKACESTNCREILFEYCTGADLPAGDSSWISRWLDSSGGVLRYGAANVVVRNIYGFDNACGFVASYFDTLDSGTCTPLTLARRSPEGFSFARRIVEATVTRYYNDGFSLTAQIGQAQYTPFTTFFYIGLACPFPLLCENILNRVCSAFSSNDLSSSRALTNLCGCYLPSSEYELYVNTYQVDKECTPPCNRSATVPIVRADNSPLICSQDLCIIDSLAINLASSVVGNVNITQICANCSSDPDSAGSCRCSIENNTINAVNSAIGNINITEQCADTFCTYVDPISGSNISLPCDVINDETINQGLAEQREATFVSLSRRNMIWVTIVAIIIIAIIIISFVYLYTCSSSQSGKVQNFEERDSSQQNFTRNSFQNFSDT